MRLLHPTIRRYDEARDQLTMKMRERVTETVHRLAMAGEILSATNPESILGRGFAIVRRHESGLIVRKSGELIEGDSIDLRFAEGKASAKIQEVQQ